MLSVVVYPSSFSEHVSQIVAGLAELEAQGVVRVCYTVAGARSIPRLNYQNLWMRVEDPRSGQRVRLCFDMADGPKIRSLDALTACDAYIKRGYSQHHLDEALAPGLRAKVIPYGLNYACLSRRDRHGLQRTFGYLLTPDPWRDRARTQPVRRIARYFATRLGVPPDLVQGVPYFDAYEMPATTSAECRAVFLTRVYARTPGASEASEADRQRINAARVALVRALRSALGARFVGGVSDSPFARDYCPDCIAEVPTDRKAYVRTLGSCLVAVTSVGRFGSTGWKLPEYLAASRCIVTEPLRYELPQPLVDGQHLLAYLSPEQCVAHCERLLASPQEAQAMRLANERYYREHLRPDRLIASCLRRALARA